MNLREILVVLLSCFVLEEFFSSHCLLTLCTYVEKKKRVTAGEVDTGETELGKCTHQWTTNNEKKLFSYMLKTVYSTTSSL